ncbi:MAG: hypothetical protein ACRDT2_00060 [Natronosporangium sp.]
MRWRRRHEPIDPNHGRDRSGRLIDGDRVRPPGWDRWRDLLDTPPAALVESTQIVPTLQQAPLMTHARQWRSSGGYR